MLQTTLDSGTCNLPIAGCKTYDLVLLHGLFGTLSNWQTVYGEFSREHSIYVPTLPLFDQSIASSPLDKLVIFLKNYLDNKGLQQIILVGNSLGGHLALLFTLKYPDHVIKLILTGSSGLYENSFNRTFPRVKDLDYITEKIKYTFYKKEVVSNDLVNEVFRTIQSPAKVLSIISLARSAQRQNLAAALKDINIPVLLIWGLQDLITPPEVGQQFKDGLPEAELKYIDECGHVPMMEQPELFNHYVREFLEK
jgi:2-hydroxy-6-oxonona-2,4-dienedioate hydrolase